MHLCICIMDWECWLTNHKSVDRLYRQDGLRQKPRRNVSVTEFTGGKPETASTR